MKFLKNMRVNGKFKKGEFANAKDISEQIERDRFLVDFSTKNNTPIVIGKQERWDELKYIDINVELYRLAKIFTLEVRDVNFANGLLVDETIDDEMVTWIKEKGFEIRGGFRRDE